MNNKENSHLHTKLINRKIEEAQQLIQDNFDRKLNLDEIAKSVGLSETRLKSGFKESFQITPHQFQIHLRLEKAKEYLQQKNLSITEIASNVGYSSLSHFINIFKREIGKTPSEYQKNYQ